MLPRPSPRGAVSMTEESVVPLCLERISSGTRNNWDGGAAASMGDCNSAGSLNNRGPPHDPR